MRGDELWGNVYGTDCLARIDKTSGAAAEAKAAGREEPDVLNGIAWDPDGKRIFELPVSNLVALSWEFAKQRATDKCAKVSWAAFACELYPKAISQLSWSLASSRIQDKHLTAKLTTAIDSNTGRFKVRDLAIATWALATLVVDTSSTWRQLRIHVASLATSLLCKHGDPKRALGEPCRCCDRNPRWSSSSHCFDLPLAVPWPGDESADRR
eukprot:Skav220125  [mRNA]  locus=scaffold731:143629:149653:- [translate_table: standard]